MASVNDVSMPKKRAMGGIWMTSITVPSVKKALMAQEITSFFDLYQMPHNRVHGQIAVNMREKRAATGRLPFNHIFEQR
jgi:hypothetical protein